jgi:hypothetical protein
VAVDARERDRFNFAHRGPTPALVRFVDEVLCGLSMDLEVGVVSIELVQPTARESSGITFTYFLMLAGEDDYVKSDTHLRRFVSDALCIDWSHLISEERTKRLVREAALMLAKNHAELTPVALDYAIWNYQRAQARPAPSSIS